MSQSPLSCPDCAGPVFIFSTKEIRCPTCQVRWDGYGAPRGPSQTPPTASAKGHYPTNEGPK